MTAQVSKIVENDFRKRLERVLYLIESYGIRYSEIGVLAVTQGMTMLLPVILISVLLLITDRG